MVSKNSYKVLCPQIDKILLVKKYDALDLENLYDALVEKIQDAKTLIHLNSYAKFIVDNFLVNAGELYDELEKKKYGDEDEKAVIYYVYSSIVDLYVPFRAELLCNEINLQIRGKEPIVFGKPSNEVEIKDASQASSSPLYSTDNEEFYTSFLKDYQKTETQPSKTNSSPFENINKIERKLKKVVIGQDEAVGTVMDSLKLIYSGITTMRTLFFMGQTGVGKTMLSKALGDNYGGHFYKINCAEFAGGHEYARLIGAPPGYTGYTDKSLLKEKSEISNKWVFLFDEIEKAHPKFMSFLLSLMDEGKLTDNLGEELDFSNSIFIFTSNIGVADLKVGSRVGFDDNEVTYENSQEEIMESFELIFSPEFRGRIDDVVFFNSLTKEDMKKIAKLELDRIPIRRTKDLINFICDKGFSTKYGARGLRKFIEKEVGIVVAEELLKQNIPASRGRYYSYKIEDDRVVVIDTINIKDSLNGMESESEDEISGT